MRILSAVYSHPDFFPPTLNALHELEKYHKVYSLSRNVSKSKSLSDKIKSYSVGKYMDIRSIEKISTIAKTILFFKFCLKMRRIIVKERIEVVLVYDNIPLFAYWLVQKTFLKKRIIWYHNHDILEIDKVRKYSIQWLSGYFETKIFKKINIFSIPTLSRKQYFNLKYFKGDFFVIPNFPAKSFYNKYKKAKFKTNNKVIKILYQGELTQNHGFEELIPCLNKSGKYQIELHIIGFIKNDYREKLINISKKNSCEKCFFIHERINFDKLPNFSNKNHIGWAVHKPVNIQYTTGSTASNKIYEYIAVGLPVILFDTEHYRDSLDKYRWAHFTDLSENNIISKLDEIFQDFNAKSEAAITDFENSLNYENNFKKVLNFLNTKALKL